MAKRNSVYLIILAVFAIATSQEAVPGTNFYINDATGSWDDANISCVAKELSLSVIDNWETFRSSDAARSLIDSQGAWVSGRLTDEGWNWYTALHGRERRIPTTSLVLPRGCFRASKIYGGIKLGNITAEKCFQACNWSGAIGLYSTMCLCEHHLRNITRTSDSLCDFTCPGRNNEMCGGLRTVSIYQQSTRAIRWASGHPRPGDECAYMMTADDREVIFWYSANCGTHFRYLCQFENHEVCGERLRCVRPSTTSSTWTGARRACENLNGHLATISIPRTTSDDDVKSTTSGRFWVGLKRKYRWQWVDGSIIPNSAFRVNFKQPKKPTDMCTSIHGDAHSNWLMKTPCSTQLPALCQKRILQVLPQTIQVEATHINMEVLTNETIKTESEESQNDTEESNILQTILYVGIGVAAGVAAVFSCCLILYLINRCHKNRMAKKSTSYHQEPRDTVRSFTTSTGQTEFEDFDGELRENESPFRRTQRLLREASIGGGSEGYRSNSWKRVANGSHRDARKLERPAMGCEIRNIYPSTERSYKDTSKAIHEVRAQFHGGATDDIEDIDCSYSGSLDTRLRKPVNRSENGVRLSDTYSLPPQSRKASENEGMLNLDSCDLYASVQKAMARLSEDNLDQIESRPDFTSC